MKFKNVTKTLTRIFNKSKSTIIKHGPQLMAAAGAGCFIAATICAIKETPDAIDALEEKEDLDPDMTMLQRGAVVLPKYKKTVCLTALGIGFTCGAWKMEAARMAELAGIASAAIKDNDKLKEVLKKEIGEEKAKEITNKLDEEKGITHVEGDDPTATPPTDQTWGIFRIDCTGKEFWSTPEKVKNALSYCRATLRKEGSIGLDDVYRELGLGGCDLELCWAVSRGDGWGYDEASVRDEFDWEFEPFADEYGRLGWNIVFGRTPKSIFM